MIWADFQPYVLPYVIGCPDPVLEHHARLAAIDFCRKTACMTVTLDPEPTDGFTLDVQPLADTGLQILRLLSVTLDGHAMPLVSTAHGMELVAQGDGNEFAFSRDGVTIAINPLQDAGVQVVAHAVLGPSFASTTVPDALLPHVQDIAHGVIASIQMVPGQAFTAPDFAAAQRDMYQRRVSTVAASVSRGRAPAKMRSRATYL